VLLDLAALQRENAEQRVQIAAILATNRQLVAEVEKLNDRVAELLAVAQRKQRKPAGGPSDKKPEAPPNVGEDLKEAFEARPVAPSLPEKTKAPKEPCGRRCVIIQDACVFAALDPCSASLRRTGQAAVKIARFRLPKRDNAHRAFAADTAPPRAAPEVRARAAAGAEAARRAA
jgi:hypothetical protein